MWSSQSYKSQGLQQNRSAQLLDDAIEQSELVIHAGQDCPSILSLNHLAKRTGVGYELLRGFIMRGRLEGAEVIKPYEKFSIAKRSGGRRYIHIPAPKLMHTQRWINHHILKKQSVHSASQAFQKGSSIQKCASRHCGAKWLIKIDISDFFGSISEIQVYRVFQSLNYQPLIAFELARLCTVTPGERSPRNRFSHWKVRKHNQEIPTYHSPLLGYLPQGAPTSPRLANLTMLGCDNALQIAAQNAGLSYTRYSDDLCFSVRKRDFGRRSAEQFVSGVYAILNKNGFRPHMRKTSIVPPGGKKVVLGLNVDGNSPKLSKEMKDRIRQHLYYLEKYGPIEHAFNRGFDSVWGLKAHLKGLIDFAKMIEVEFAGSSLKQFQAVEWPV